MALLLQQGKNYESFYDYYKNSSNRISSNIPKIKRGSKYKSHNGKLLPTHEGGKMKILEEFYEVRKKEYS